MEPNYCTYELKDKIEILREEMIMMGLSKGLDNEQTIRISQKLDTYLTIYTMMQSNLKQSVSYY